MFLDIKQGLHVKMCGYIIYLFIHLCVFYKYPNFIEGYKTSYVKHHIIISLVSYIF